MAWHIFLSHECHGSCVDILPKNSNETIGKQYMKLTCIKYIYYSQLHISNSDELCLGKKILFSEQTNSTVITIPWEIAVSLHSPPITQKVWILSTIQWHNKKRRQRRNHNLRTQSQGYCEFYSAWHLNWGS